MDMPKDNRKLVKVPKNTMEQLQFIKSATGETYIKILQRIVGDEFSRTKTKMLEKMEELEDYQEIICPA